MTKYQEALDYVNKSVCTAMACLGINDEKTRESLHTLQELVNKETPMKITNWIYNDTHQKLRVGYCPKCHPNKEKIKFSQDIVFQHMNYCPVCGKKLDWSE